jgi:hypothetical protein
LHRLAAERAKADGMLQNALAPIFQNGLRYRQHKDTILDEEMPAGGKRHRRRHVLAARLEWFFWVGQLCFSKAMSHVLYWWWDLPAPMKAAIEQFLSQLGAAIDSVDPVKRALDTQVPEHDRGETLNTALRWSR